jgi:polyisoprenoid-binding protein YceI
MTLKSLLTTSLLAATLGSTAAQAAPANYSIDMAHTSAIFNINHLGFSTLHGRFGDMDGTLMLDTDNIENSKVSMTIDTASVTTFHEKRDEHLRSPDFFNAAEFPEMTFESSKVVKTGDNTATLEGELTLLGVTKPVVLDLTINKVGPHPFTQAPMAGFSATGIIKRSDFGMGYGLPAIGDDVALRLDVEAAPE